MFSHIRPDGFTKPPHVKEVCPDGRFPYIFIMLSKEFHWMPARLFNEYVNIAPELLAAIDG
jgi:hypothetical protein